MRPLKHMTLGEPVDRAATRDEAPASTSTAGRSAVSPSRSHALAGLSSRPSPRSEAGQQPASFTSLESLPAEIHHEILHRLQAASPYEYRSGIAALQQTSRTLQRSVNGHDDTIARYQAMRELAPLVWEATYGFARLAPRPYWPYGLVLGNVSPETRTRLLAKVLSFTDTYLARSIVEFAAGLAHLDRSQRNSLFDAAMSLSNSINMKAAAIAGLGQAAMHLLPAQREALVAATLGQEGAQRPSEESEESEEREEREEYVAKVIGGGGNGGLGASLGHLSEPQRNSLVQAVIGMSDDRSKAFAIQGLSAGLEHLDAAQRDRLIDAAIGIDSFGKRCKAVGALVAQSKHVAPRLRDAFIACVTNLENERALKAVCRDLGAGLGLLSQPQRDELFDAAMDIEERYKGRAFGGLAAGLRHLGDAQRSALVDAATSLPPTERFEALGGFGAVLEHLTASQRDQLIAATLVTRDELDRMRFIIGGERVMQKGIVGLGKGLRHMSPRQREALINAARNFQCPSTHDEVLLRLLTEIQQLPVTIQPR